MIEKATVDYIVGNDEGDAETIYKVLQEKNILKKLYKNKDKELIKKSLLLLPSTTIFSISSKSKGKGNEVENYNVSLPIFSSHVSLPVKLGEEIFLIKFPEDKNEYNIIDSYWMSRPHNLTTSENLNYSRNNDLKNSKLTYVGKPIQFESITQKNPTKNNTLSKNLRDNTNFFQDNMQFSFNTSPFFKSNLNNLSIKSSNNSMIQLGENSKKGNIRLISGIHESIDYDLVGNMSTKDDNYENKILDFKIYSKKYSINDDSPYFYFYQDENDKQSKLPVRNLNLNIPEDIEFQETVGITKEEYFNNIKKEYDFENIYEDYSKIEILSTDNKASVFYDNTFSFNTNSNLLNIKNEVTSSQKETFSGSLRIKYFIPDLEINGEDDLPTINISSTNLRFLSKPKNVSDKNAFDNNDNGEILLLKNSFDQEKNARINIAKDGNILIDGKNILIGSVNREKNLKNGEGSLVMLGPSQEMESLVLGYQLKNLLLEHFSLEKDYLTKINESITSLNDVTKELYDILKSTNSNTNIVSTKINAALGGLGAPGVLINEISEYAKIDSNINTSLINKGKYYKANNMIKDTNLISTGSNSQNRIDNLINKIDIILSKFSKTS